jgi:hypothetical protein
LNSLAMTAENLSELRARYYDWCSARIAERLVQLSPDEIWHRAAMLSDAGELFVWQDEQGQAFPPGNTFFSARVLAHLFAQELDLPTFEDWVDLYRADPGRFQREMIMVDSPERAVPNH